MKNTKRYDLSDWLIHFFRRIDLSTRNAIICPEDMGFNNIHEDGKMSALFMLRCAIRHGTLWPTWSYRNNVRAIYGPRPAICFTEMPIAAFIESGSSRGNRGEAMSQFALVFPKKDIHQIGARPVIYGLDGDTINLPSGENGRTRIIDENLLPRMEQYRYVTFNPSSSKPIDWSHEREWRWPYKSNKIDFEKKCFEYGDDISEYKDMPSLDLYSSNISEIGVVVQSNEQCKVVIHDILVLVDKKVLPKNKYKFVLSIENLPSAFDIIDPDKTNEAINDSLVDLSYYYNYCHQKCSSIEKKVDELILLIKEKAPKPRLEEQGGSWLWILDNTSALARAMIYCNRVIISDEGRYLIDIKEFSYSLSLRQRETMIGDLAKLLMETFNVECGYFSVLNSCNPNDLPFYNSNHDKNTMFYNFSWKE